MSALSKNRIKKAIIHPAVTLSIAALSYLAGLKQSKVSPSCDPFDELREAMGGKLTHAVLEGSNGVKAEYFPKGNVFKGREFDVIKTTDPNGKEVIWYFDSKTAEWVYSAHNGDSTLPVVPRRYRCRE